MGRLRRQRRLWGAHCLSKLIKISQRSWFSHSDEKRTLSSLFCFAETSSIRTCDGKLHSHSPWFNGLARHPPFESLPCQSRVALMEDFVACRRRWRRSVDRSELSCEKWMMPLPQNSSGPMSTAVQFCWGPLTYDVSKILIF